MRQYTASPVIDHRDALGEAPVWDADREQLIWVDLVGRKIHALRSDGEPGSWIRAESTDTSVGASFALPRAGGGLVLGTGAAIVLRDSDGSEHEFARLPMADETARWNDARVDSAGRLVAGWLTEASGVCAGAVVRIDPDGTMETIVERAGLANGLDWSPDGHTLYLADSTRMRVEAFVYDPASGRASEPRTFVEFASGDGMPDGLTVDADGTVWVAAIWAGVVRGFAPSGELIAEVRTPTWCPTGVGFGGRDLDTLFVTSLTAEVPAHILAHGGVTEERRAAAAAQPHGGGIFATVTGAKGRMQNGFGA